MWKPWMSTRDVENFWGVLRKVAEHSFQEPIPNSPLLLSYLSFGTRFCKSQD